MKSTRNQHPGIDYPPPNNGRNQSLQAWAESISKPTQGLHVASARKILTSVHGSSSKNHPSHVQNHTRELSEYDKLKYPYYQQNEGDQDMLNGSASEIEGRFNPQNAENRRSLRRNAGALQNAAALIDSKIRERDKNGSHDHNENNKNDKKKRSGGKDQLIVDLLKKVKKKGSRRQLYNFRPETKKDHDAVFLNSPSYQLEFLIQQALYSQDGPGSKHRRLQNRRIIENATSASELKTVLNNYSQNDHNHSINVINQHSIPSLVISKNLKNYAFDRLDDLRKELNQEVTMHTDNLDSMNTN